MNPGRVLSVGRQSIQACSLLFVGAVICVLSNAMGHAQLVINEVMADNRGAVENGSTFPDYVELHNTASFDVFAGGMGLTDDPVSPHKYVIPGGVTVPANSYLVLWCDVNFSAPGLHTGFGLGANTDRLQLYAADGFTLIDDISFGISVGNLSIGRIPNGTGTWALNQPTAGSANAAQTMGAKTGLRLNEWMASPGTGLEDWIEVYNGNALPVDVSGLVITDLAFGTPANRAIPALSFIGAGGYIQFFASDLAEPDADHLDFKLGAGGETLTIYDTDRTTLIDRVTFGAQAAGISQGRAPDGSDNITSFPPGGSTPEGPNQIEITNVAISEVLTHTDPPFEDAIEIQNLTAVPVDISHWWLSDSASDLKKYRIPAGTILPAFGFKVFYQYQFDVGPTAFSLNSAEGDQVFLSSGNASGQLTGQQTFVQFGALRNGVSIGRVPTSQGVDFVPLSARTFGADNPATLGQFRSGTGRTNALPRIGPVVISEIHYQPLGGGVDLDEFIELHNISGATVLLYDVDFPTNSWRVRTGVTFDFPLSLSMPAGGYLLLVSFDPVTNPIQLADFRARFAVPESVPVLGPFAGRLSNSGEEVRLLQPDHPEGPGPNEGLVPYELVEAIEYGIAAPWPAGAAGTGSSLQRTTESVYGNEPLNWFAAAPNPGRAGLVDTDADGMPDAWEDANGLNRHSAADADTDADADGASNLAEYRAGTNPQSVQSVFRFTSIQDAAASMALKFHAVAGKSYQLQARSQLGSGAWITISNIPAPTVTGELVLNVAKSGMTQFYRVVSGTP